MSNSLGPHGLYSAWNYPGQNTGVGSLSHLQGIFPTQGLGPSLPHCRQILYQLSHKGSQGILEWAAYPFSRGSSQPRNQTGVSCIASGFFTNWVIREALTTGKIIALIILTFVSKVMSLLFNMLSRFVIAFLPWWVRWWRICLQCGRPGFNPWVGKISWRRKWQPTPVFLPGKSHGCRNLVGYSPWGRKESDMTEQLHFLSFFLSFQKVSNF